MESAAVLQDEVHPGKRPGVPHWEKIEAVIPTNSESTAFAVLSPQDATQFKRQLTWKIEVGAASKEQSVAEIHVQHFEVAFTVSAAAAVPISPIPSQFPSE